jgi:DNA-binding beta-propeller fold protein YncE
LPSNLAVTADWLNHTLSLVDFDALVAELPADGGVPAASAGSDAGGDGSVVTTSAGDAANIDAATVRVGEIDLSAYAQAPYEVKLTPDGATAIVTMSAGFFAVTGAGLLVNATKVPTTPGEVLFVDLASRSVVASLDTGAEATGIAITHDGTRAFISHEGTSDLTVVDVKTQQILAQVDVGGTFAEEVSLDDSDTVGIVTYLDPTSQEKNVRTFAVADMASTLSAPIPLGTDAAGVPFFPETKIAFVVLAYNPLTSPASGYALIDATNPASPVKLVQTMWTDATYVAYQAIQFPAHGTVLVPLATGGTLSVREYAFAGSDVSLRTTIPVAATQLFGAFGAVVDAQGHLALTMPQQRQIALLDIGSGAVVTVPWFSPAGPLGIALR